MGLVEQERARWLPKPAGLCTTLRVQLAAGRERALTLSRLLTLFDHDAGVKAAVVQGTTCSQAFSPPYGHA